MAKHGRKSKHASRKMAHAKRGKRAGREMHGMEHLLGRKEGRKSKRHGKRGSRRR